jgi:hypothetical protein
MRGRLLVTCVAYRPRRELQKVAPRNFPAFRRRLGKTRKFLRCRRQGGALAIPGFGRAMAPLACRNQATNCERNNTMSAHTLKTSDLNQFTGSEHWYRHGINRKVLFTDGAKYVADAGGAYWLLDEIALIQPYEKAVAAEPFQVWKLKVNRQDDTAVLTCEDGNYKQVYEKKIPFTDFPLDEITLWFADNTIYLPSEH